MSITLELKEDTYEKQLLSILPAYAAAVAAAEPLFQLEGERLEKIARVVPYHQATYAQKAIEMKSVLQWLEIHKNRLEAKHLKNYQKGQRALSTTDMRMLMAGERDIVELEQVIVEVTNLYGQLNEITEAFKQMGWMVGHVTKLRVAELGDVIL